MSTGLVVVVTAIYATIGVMQLFKGQSGFALMWGSYAMANVGLIWAGGAK